MEIDETGSVAPDRVSDEAHMDAALAVASAMVGSTSPNPWVGTILVGNKGDVFSGVTESSHGRHAEAVALERAGEEARGGTLYVTLEPCPHVGENPACTELIANAGIARVIVGMQDPDPRVAGRGISRLRSAGIEVEVGVRRKEVERQLAPYLRQRRTGQPFVILKVAMTMDGRTTAPDGTSKWITGPAAREDVHRLRSQSDAIIVGAGTVRADNPSLTVRLPDREVERQPQRVVVGAIPDGALIEPALSWRSSLPELLNHLGEIGCLQVLVEGGATLAGAFHRENLVDRYVLYLAPVALGGDDGRPVLAGAGMSTIEDAWRGEIVDITKVGQDVRITIEPSAP